MTQAAPSSPVRRRLMLGLAAMPVVGAFAAPALLPEAAAAKTADGVWVDRRGLALRGHDPVAYFEEGMPAAGSSAHALTWAGAEWRFVSAANQQAFAADPTAFAPQFGGHCSYAVSRGYLASSVPEAWDIVDGRLYLNFSLGVRNRWRRDIPGNIAKGQSNWPSLRSA